MSRTQPSPTDCNGLAQSCLPLCLNKVTMFHCTSGQIPTFTGFVWTQTSTGVTSQAAQQCATSTTITRRLQIPANLISHLGLSIVDTCWLFLLRVRSMCWYEM